MSGKFVFGLLKKPITREVHNKLLIIPAGESKHVIFARGKLSVKRWLLDVLDQKLKGGGEHKPL